jgi:ribosomal protein L19
MSTASDEYRKIQWELMARPDAGDSIRGSGSIVQGEKESSRRFEVPTPDV